MTRRATVAVSADSRGRPGRRGSPSGPAFLGIMSGTSLDGVDYVLVTFEGEQPRFRRHWSRSFPPTLRRRLFECAVGRLSSWDTARLHHDLGRFYALAAGDGLDGERLAGIGVHGQTVFHSPGGTHPATLQIGEAAYLAEAFRVPTVANFRAADLAAGGQGAPLATLFHVRVFGAPGRHVAVQNLGGIGNVTSIDARNRSRDPAVLAFDTGPGNMPLDGAMARLSQGRKAMDRDGRLASAGRVDVGLVERWLRHPFLRRRPPKSTGRELFGDPDLTERWQAMEAAGLAPADRLATLTEFVARSVALNHRLHLPGMPDRVVLCGGGAKNRHLVGRLAELLRMDQPALECLPCADLGWPTEAVEGAAFALLARERLFGRPGNLPTTTGARRPVCCGQVLLP